MSKSYETRLTETVKAHNLMTEFKAHMRQYFGAFESPGWTVVEPDPHRQYLKGSVLPTYYEHPMYDLALREFATMHGLVVDEPDNTDVDDVLSVLRGSQPLMDLVKHCVGKTLIDTANVLRALEDQDAVDAAIDRGAFVDRSKLLADIRTPMHMREWMVKHGYF